MTTKTKTPERLHLGGSVYAHPGLTDLLTPDLDKLTPHPNNPRNGDTDTIAHSITTNGLYRPIYAQRSTGRILAGNHTYAAALELGATRLPVVWLDVDDETATKIMLVDNRAADLGRYDDALLADLLRGLDALDGTGYTGDDLDHLDFLNAQTLAGLERAAEVEAGAAARPQRRTLPLRLILSLSPGPSVVESMMGARLGWQSGVISSAVSSVTRYRNRYPKHRRVGFMDNPYRDYDHAAHLDAVRTTKPISCTTRDLYTKQQAEEEGVAHYSIEETLEQAASLAPHVEDVIVIPKFDCLDRLPERIGDARLVLGYSVQSSYGGTPLPAEAFKGRPVHLLGGSWAKQRAYLNLLGDDVVSLDNNHVLMVAQFGQVCRTDGTVTSLAELLGRDQWSVYFAALALSLTEIATVHNDFGVDLTPYDEEATNWDGPLPEPTGEAR